MSATTKTRLGTKADKAARLKRQAGELVSKGARPDIFAVPERYSAIGRRSVQMCVTCGSELVRKKQAE